MLLLTILVIMGVSCILAQYGPPPPQILSHKQALNHDGNFRYVFTSDNGLVQGETISPDGSRNGAYSYIDPTGRKISVRYTAGRDGFRILEGDHLPRAPQPEYPLPYVRNSDAAEESADYGENSANTGPSRFKLYTAESGGVVDDRDYSEEPGKPHSFGDGYIFEFAG